MAQWVNIFHTSPKNPGSWFPEAEDQHSRLSSDLHTYTQSYRHICKRKQIFLKERLKKKHHVVPECLSRQFPQCCLNWNCLLKLRMVILSDRKPFPFCLVGVGPLCPVCPQQRMAVVTDTTQGLWRQSRSTERWVRTRLQGSFTHFFDSLQGDSWEMQQCPRQSRSPPLNTWSGCSTKSRRKWKRTGIKSGVYLIGHMSHLDTHATNVVFQDACCFNWDSWMCFCWGQP